MSNLGPSYGSHPKSECSSTICVATKQYISVRVDNGPVNTYNGTTDDRKHKQGSSWDSVKPHTMQNQHDSRSTHDWSAYPVLENIPGFYHVYRVFFAVSVPFLDIDGF